MMITLTGENSFGWQNELAKLSSAFMSEHGELAIERLDGEEAEFTHLQEVLTSLPFLVSKKVVVLRTPSKNKQFIEQFEQVIAQIPETTDVILVEPKLDKRLSYYKLLKSKTDFREFNKLDVPGLVKWLVETARSSGGSISSSDAHYLIERVGDNQQMLSTELEKLLIYDNKISREDINLLTEATPQSTVFQLLEAAFAGNTKRTLYIYSEQRKLKVEPPQIIAMLVWQLHVLAIVKTAKERQSEAIAKEARLNPYVVNKSQPIASKLSMRELKKLTSDLLEIDLKSKSTNINTDEALQNYLLGLGE